jgi:protein-S-isoprenylcysteine O-methyltransferase Ste14
MLIILLALFLFAAGSLSYDFLYFSGMGQIREQRNSSGIAKEGRLETRGILRITRHPWYLAALIVIWPRDLNHAVILTNIILSFYIIIGTLLEEKKLVSEFREEYLVYQNEVSMLFPWKWLRKKFSFKLPRP